MDVKNFGLYGFIDHKYKDHNIRLVGKIVSLNEGDETCRMCFMDAKNHPIYEEDGIPMEAVKIDEGVFDNMRKRFGTDVDVLKNNISRVSKWAHKIYKKVGGLVRTVIGGRVIPYTNSVMIGQFAALHEIPKNVTLVLSDDTKSVAREQNVIVKDQLGISDDTTKDDLKHMNAFLQKVIDKYKSANPDKAASPEMEGFKTSYLEAVNEEYGMKTVSMLTEGNQLDRFFNPKKYYSLHEDSTASYVNDDALDPGRGVYAGNQMPQWNVKDIVQDLMQQLEQAFSVGGFTDSTEDYFENALEDLQVTKDEYDSDPDVKAAVDKDFKDIMAQDTKQDSIKETHPLLIWGAPGIGKTQVTKQCIFTFNKIRGQKTNCIDVPLQMESRDSFTLQGHIKDENGNIIGAGEFIENWLPMYKKNWVDDEENAIADKAANARMQIRDYKTLIAENKEAKIDGGLLFFDELLRAQPEVIDIVMKLLDERSLGDYVLGSHWVMISATNRPWEIEGRDITVEYPWTRRFQNVAFVPELADWIKWAEGYDYNPLTGEYDHYQHTPRIEQTIIDFIKSAGEGVFYEIVAKPRGSINTRQVTKATPASWEKASQKMVNNAHRNAKLAGKKWRVQRINPATGKKEMIPTGITNADRLAAVATNIGQGTVYNKYANYLDISRYFPVSAIESIWKFGSIDPHKKVYIPENVNPSIAGEPSILEELVTKLFTPEILNSYTAGINGPADLPKFQKFDKALSNVVYYMANYMNLCGNVSIAIRETITNRIRNNILKGVVSKNDENSDSLYVQNSYQAVWCKTHGYSIKKIENFSKVPEYQKDAFLWYSGIIACLHSYSSMGEVIDKFFGQKTPELVGERDINKIFDYLYQHKLYNLGADEKK